MCCQGPTLRAQSRASESHGHPAGTTHAVAYPHKTGWQPFCLGQALPSGRSSLAQPTVLYISWYAIAKSAIGPAPQAVTKNSEVEQPTVIACWSHPTCFGTCCCFCYQHFPFGGEKILSRPGVGQAPAHTGGGTRYGIDCSSCSCCKCSCPTGSLWSTPELAYSMWKTGVRSPALTGASYMGLAKARLGTVLQSPAPSLVDVTPILCYWPCTI